MTPGFSPFPTSFGNGVMDNRFFQIDSEFARFRENTMAARAERLEKYVCFNSNFDRLEAETCESILIRMIAGYPAYFDLQMESEQQYTLICRLTRERLRFDRKMRLIDAESLESTIPPYRNAFDALVSQVPEDVAVVALPEGKTDENVALHITAPSHWVPEEKIGASFLQTHAPVPNFERIAQASASLLETVLMRRPVVRFNWGIEFTDRLNLHPEPPSGTNAEEWNRRRPRLTEECPVYLRIERQILAGLRESRALLFTIRVYVRPVTELSPVERNALHQTLLSMPEESRLYKGLPPETFAETVRYLAATAV